MIYFYCTSWQFFHIIVKWRISPTTEQIMFTFSILLFHFYSHIPCGMWLSYIWSIKITKIISTHTSRVGCDRYTDWSEILVINFYSHIPCGMWPQWQYSTAIWQKFLLTHPVWDVTRKIFLRKKIWNFYSHIPCGMWPIQRKPSFKEFDFYSHIPCGMWLRRDPTWVSRIHISTHTSRVGCDTIPIYHIYQSNQFLLTHPVWDVTSRLPLLRRRLLISTHTSRVGCD